MTYFDFITRLPNFNEERFLYPEPMNWAEKKQEWPEFSAEGFIPPEEYGLLVPLSVKYAKYLWSIWVSRDHSLIWDMPEESWPKKLLRESDALRRTISWVGHESEPFVPYAKRSDRPDVIAEACTIQCKRDDSAVVVVFFSRFHAMATTWRMFLRYWQNFSLDDEGNFVICPSDQEAIVLAAYRIFFGKRT
jgi:hypothetical protein